MLVYRRCEIVMGHVIDPRWISRSSTEDVIKDHVDDGKMSKELKKTVTINDHRNDNDELIAEVLKSVFSWWVKASTCHNKTSGAKEKDEGRVRAKQVEECAYAFFAREVCDAKVTYETAPTKPATTQAPAVVDEATIISPENAINAPNAGENSASDRPHRHTTTKNQ